MHSTGKTDELDPISLNIQRRPGAALSVWAHPTSTCSPILAKGMLQVLANQAPACGSRIPWISAGSADTRLASWPWGALELQHTRLWLLLSQIALR
jgi:hypothetical protein